QAKATRTGQLLAGVMRRAAAAAAAAAAAPMPGNTGDTPLFVGNQMRSDDPRLSAIYANFTSNLQDICTVGRQAGARVIVCTVATNLRDSAPMASLGTADLSAAQVEAWQKNVDEGMAHEAAGATAQAVACFRRAEAIDDRPADLHF